MLKISHAGCLGLSPATSAQFTLETRVTAQNHEKFTKTPILGVQVHSKCPTFVPSFVGPLSPSGMKFCHEILETLSYHNMVKTRSLYLNWS